MIKVLAALAVLDEATNEEYANPTSADSLLSDIKRTQPPENPGTRTSNAIRPPPAGGHIDPRRAGRTRRREHRFRRRPPAPLVAVPAFRHQRARESDLLYEAYDDAFDIDIGGDTAR